MEESVLNFHKLNYSGWNREKRSIDLPAACIQKAFLCMN